MKDVGFSASLFTSLIDAQRFDDEIADAASFVLACLSGLHLPPPTMVVDLPCATVAPPLTIVPADAMWTLPSAIAAVEAGSDLTPPSPRDCH